MFRAYLAYGVALCCAGIYFAVWIMGCLELGFGEPASDFQRDYWVAGVLPVIGFVALLLGVAEEDKPKK